MPLDISYPYTKSGVNRPKQTQVIERKPKVDALPPADFGITITRFSLKTWLKNPHAKSKVHRFTVMLIIIPVI
jgi:hypothetical protein